MSGEMNGAPYCKCREDFFFKRLTSSRSEKLLQKISNSLPASVNYPEKCTGVQFGVLNLNVSLKERQVDELSIMGEK